MATSLGIVKKFFPNVNTVIDGKKSIQVEVTKKDSSSSTVKNHKGCAMAVACKRTFKVDGVIISRNRAYLIKESTAVRYALPASVSREVVSFDRGAGFAEGVYALSRPPKHISKSKIPRVRGEQKDYERKFVHTTSGIRAKIGNNSAA